jgi:outer membrane protein assembly factor BamB
MIESKKLADGKLLAVMMVLLGASSSAQAADWSSWRGPNDDFTVDAKNLADKWPDDGPPRLWQRDLGAGYSAIAAVGNRLYTMYRDGDYDVVTALEARTGDTVWEHRYEAKPHKDQKLDFGVGPNSTPLVLEDRVITIGFTSKMRCINKTDGKLIWSKDLVEDFGGKVQEFGYAASPILYKGDVIALTGGEKHGAIALNPRNGALVWGGEPADISYATPVMINVDGQDQMVVMSSTEVLGMDPTKGTILWRHPCENRYKNNATDPIWHAGKNLLWVATQLDGATRVLKLTQTGGKTNVEQVWFNDKVKIFHWNAVLIDDHVYASIGSNVTMVAAVDITTGEIEWRERGFHKALCLYADDKLIFLDENGQLVLAKVSPEGMKILSQAQMTEKVSWTTPTLVDRTLYIRDKNTIMALNVGG